MERTYSHETDQRISTNQIEYYMPATPRLSTEAGQIERFVGSLFRRRGGLRPAPRKDR